MLLKELKEFRNYLKNVQFIKWGRVYTEKTPYGYRCKLYCVDWYHQDNFCMWDVSDFKSLLALKFGTKRVNKVIIKQTSNKYAKKKLQDIIFYIKK